MPDRARGPAHSLEAEMRLSFRCNVDPTVILGVILGLYRDNGKENGNCYLEFRV